MRTRYFPETWSGSIWRPQINDGCKVIESHDIFNTNDRVVVEVTMPGRSFVVVSKLLDESSKGQIPIDNIEKID